MRFYAFHFNAEVFDKGYYGQHVARLAKAKQVFLRNIKKNNMKDKNKAQDKFISKMRCPD